MIPRLPVIEVPEGTTATGYCGKCGRWSRGARVVAEIHGDSGAGGIVLRCMGGCRAPAAERPRTWT